VDQGAQKEKDMFEVTDKASEMVKEFFKSREKIEPLRIFIAGVG
jgi:Fe-S cluster assembly iron-binding protein IscA